MSRAVVALAAVAGALAAQVEVTVHCPLPAGVMREVREHVTRRLAQQVMVHWVEPDARQLVDDLRAAKGPAIDVVFGLDAHWLAQLAREGRLEPYVSRHASTLRPQFRGGEHYVVPLLSPWRLVHDESYVGSSAPKDHDDLLHASAVRGELFLCEPRAQPSLFAGWMQRELRRGGEEHALAWLRTLDAQVSGYVPSPGAVFAALGKRHDSFGIVPACEATDLPVCHRDVAPGLPWLGLGLALGRQGRTEVREATRALYDELASPELAAVLGARTDMQAAPRDGVPPAASRPAEGAGAGAVALPPPGDFDPDSVPLERWLQLWERDVLGRGAYSFTLATVLDLVFGAAFLVFLWFVYRRVRTDP